MPYETEIAPTPEAMQALVSGTILAVYCTADGTTLARSAGTCNC